MREARAQQYFLLIIMLIHGCNTHRSLRFTDIFQATYISYSYKHHLTDDVLEAQRSKWAKTM